MRVEALLIVLADEQHPSSGRNWAISLAVGGFIGFYEPYVLLPCDNGYVSVCPTNGIEINNSIV